MRPDPASPGDRVSALRVEFDRAFATPVRPPEAPGVNLLAIRVGTEPYAVRLEDVSAVQFARGVTPLPGSPPSLLGLTALRGVLRPLYDLCALFGRPRTEAPRWLVVGAKAPIALAFDALEAHLRAPAAALLAAPEAGIARSHVREVVRAGGSLRPVVDFASVVEWIGSLAPQAHQERSDPR